MRSGRLRHLLQLQELASASPRQSTSGERLDPWANFASVRARISPVSGKERRAAGQTQSVIDTEIEIRYLDGVVAGMRGVHAGKVYTIHAVVDPDERNKRLLLQCTAGQVNAEAGA